MNSDRQSMVSNQTASTAQSNRFNQGDMTNDPLNHGFLQQNEIQTYSPQDLQKLKANYPNLSQNGIFLLNQLPDKEKFKGQSMILQIVSEQIIANNRNENSNDPQQMAKVFRAKYTISDGNLSTKSVIQALVYDDLQEKPKLWDIVKIDSLIKMVIQGQMLIILRNIKVLYSGLTQAIGSPIDIKKALQNGDDLSNLQPVQIPYPIQNSHSQTNTLSQSSQKRQYLNISGEQAQSQTRNNNSGGAYNFIKPPTPDQQFNNRQNFGKTSLGDQLPNTSSSSKDKYQNSVFAQKQQNQTLSSSEANIMPIKALNTFSRDWKIQARIVQKSDKRQTKNGGSLLKMEIVDRYNTPIEATFFNDAADFFEHKIHVGKVYDFCDGSIKLANKKFTTVKNDFTLTFEKSSQITEVADDGSISQETFEYQPISKCEDLTVGASIDLIGVVLDITSCDTIKLKNNRQKQRRYITIIDESFCSISLTIWGEGFCQRMNEVGQGDILAMKGGRLSEFGGKTINVADDHASIMVNPSNPRGKKVYDWYIQQVQGGEESMKQIKHLSNLQSSRSDKAELNVVDQSNDKQRRNQLNFICEITSMLQDENDVDQQHFFFLNGYISLIKNDDKIFYIACPNDNCRRKVTEEHQQQGQAYRCEACNKVYRTCQPTYMIQAKITDFTDTIYINFPRDNGTALMGMTAQEFKHFRDRATEEELSAYFDSLLFKQFNIMVKGKFEFYGGENRMRFFAIKVFPIKEVMSENRALIKRLDVYKDIEPKCNSL
eukprot:403342085